MADSRESTLYIAVVFGVTDASEGAEPSWEGRLATTSESGFFETSSGCAAAGAATFLSTGVAMVFSTAYSEVRVSTSVDSWKMVVRRVRLGRRSCTSTRASLNEGLMI